MTETFFTGRISELLSELAGIVDDAYGTVEELKQCIDFDDAYGGDYRQFVEDSTHCCDFYGLSWDLEYLILGTIEIRLREQAREQAREQERERRRLAFAVN